MAGGRALGGFLIAVALFAAAVPFFYREDVLGEPLAPLVLLTAKTTYGVLQWAGIAVARDGPILSAPGGFAYEVYYRCTGFLPVLCLTVGVLAFPAPIRRKLVGLAIGIPLLLGFNLVRLVHLFQIGVTRPDLFDLAHTYLWEAATILSVAVVWLGYVAWYGAPDRASRATGPRLARRVRV
ncbi:MAG: exosortase H [bacterium]|nr:exosortase H [bacterium]